MATNNDALFRSHTDQIVERFIPDPVDSIRLAVLTVSPKRQYRGIRRPTTPATQEP